MMMNIRGLIADDPAHTAYLQTLPKFWAGSPHLSLASGGLQRENVPLEDMANRGEGEA